MENYKYLEILEADTIKETKMKKKKEFLRQTRKHLKPSSTAQISSKK